MALAFKIHEDESSSRGIENIHEHKTGNRAVLGDIQNKFTRTYVATKREVISSDSESISSGFIENIKALELKDKLSSLPKSKTGTRSPLKDLRNCKIGEYDPTSNEKGEFSVETFSFTDNASNKENELKKQLTQCSGSISTQKDDLNIDDSESLPKDDVSTCDESPKISRLELSKTVLDNLYAFFDYKNEIYLYLKTLEKEFQPSAYYMRRQPEITHSMRTILVDWLVDVAEEYNLGNDTLFRTVSLVDRFLSVMAITKAKLQLLGTSAMLIAAKYEEVYPPEVGAFVYITDDSYSASQVIRMERLLLKVLSFDVSNPTLYTFLMHILSCEQIPTKILYLAMYLSELTLLEAEPYLEYYPSMVASGAIVLARHCLDFKDIWPSHLVKMTGYSLTQLSPVISHLNETHQKSFASSHPAIRQKYSTAKYRYVSQVPFRKLILRDSLVS